eukprot:5222819-Pleurochrysis_carterae.AAC.1
MGRKGAIQARERVVNCVELSERGFREAFQDSIIDSIASPAEDGDGAFASARRMRMRSRLLFWRCMRYAGREAGEVM